MNRPTAVAAWVWNIRAQPRVSLRLRGGTFAGTARELDDPAELEQAREAICETVNPSDHGECALHLRGRPTRQKIKELLLVRHGDPGRGRAWGDNDTGLR